MEKTEFEQMCDKALEQLMKGQSLTSKNGVFAPLLQQFLEIALESEMNAHLDEQERESGNKRNGKGSKRLKTTSGEIILSTPQDRKSRFTPQIVKKRETVLADNLAPQIIGLYSKGMSFRDISDHIQQMYDVEISHVTLDANFWLWELTDLKSRGVKDILIACTENLTGFSEAILACFPQAEVQTCIIHQIRNSLKYVASKDQKAFMQDLKTVYQAPTKDKAELELKKLEDKWG